MKFIDIFSKIINCKDLTFDESREMMRSIMTGNFSNTQIGSLLTALRMKGETSEEIAGFSQGMHDLIFPIKQHPDALDIVGTGKASFKTFNVSTMTGLVLSSMGIKVAKHGDRSSKSKCGSADFLEGLGFNLRVDSSLASRILEKHKFVFLYTPFYHRSMKHAAKAIQDLGIKTVFGIVGPLANPMGVKHQLIGVYKPSLLHLVAQSLQLRGHKHVVVVYNDLGADEIMNNGITQVVELYQNKITEYKLNVADFGLSELPPESIGNRSVSESVFEAKKLMKGEITPISEFVAINGAMGMKIAGKGDELSQNTSKILDHISSGKVYDHVHKLVEASGGENVDNGINILT